MRRFVALIFIFMCAAASPPDAHARQISVEANKSIAIPIRNGDAASVVIGNPNIADVSVHNSNLLFITGRTFGTTNLLVYNAEGKKLYAGDVAVTTSNASIMTVNRAGENHTFDCAPNCRPILAIGDEQGYFNRNLEQNLQVQQLNSAE